MGDGRHEAEDGRSAHGAETSRAQLAIELTFRF